MKRRCRLSADDDDDDFKHTWKSLRIVLKAAKGDKLEMEEDERK